MIRSKRFCLILTLLVVSLGITEQAHAEDGKHLFILSGQSNMRKPLPESFRQVVAGVFGEDRVITTTVAHPSQPIRKWVKDWAPPPGVEAKPDDKQGEIYERLIKSVKKSIGDHAIESVTFIWMQGEADAKAGWAGVYKQSFLSIIEQLKRDLDQDNVNFVLGRINDYWLPSNNTPDGDHIRAIQQQLGEENAHGDWVNTDDLNRGVNPWGGFSEADGHFPPPAYRVMGQRFAYKACKLIDPSAQIDPALIKENFIDSADDIETHAGIGAAVAGTKPHAKHAGGETGLNTLTDGKFAELSHTEPEWIGYAPQDQPIQLIIDLGETTTIQTIGINALFSSKSLATFPDKITYSTSADGKDYQVNGSRYNSIHYANSRKLRQIRADGIEPTAVMLLTEQRVAKQPVKARYIKITINPGKQWVFIDEVVINAQAK